MVLDLDLLRTDKGGNPNKIRENARRRFDDVNAVDEVIRLDEQWRKTRFTLDSLNKAKNQISKEYGAKMKQQREAAKKNQEESNVPLKSTVEIDDKILDLAILFEKINKISTDTNLEELKAYRRQVEEQTTKVNQELEEIEKKRNEILREIGNLLNDQVPISNDEDENEVIHVYGNFESGKKDFQCKSHVDLITLIDGVDSEKGAEISGSRGYYLKGAAWFLKEALKNYAVRFLVDNEYSVIEPPFWMRKTIMSEVAQLNQFDEELYKVISSKGNLDSEDKYLIATSEQPIAALHRNEWLNPQKLPIKYCGVSTCFRQEVGAHGRDTRGIFRVHQFDKVEQFVISSPEDSWSHFETMVLNSRNFLESLKIPYRVVSIVSGALNNAAAMKYDVEAWFIGSQQFRELVSVSNCTDYQSRRLGIRFGQTKKMQATSTEYVHMLNGTMCATTRTVCALLETFQTPEGILVPSVLKPYMPEKYSEFIPFVNAK